MKILRWAMPVAAALLAVTAPVASAVHTSPAVTVPGGELELSVTDADDYTYSADLQCMPSGGTHSNADAACYSLKRARGNFDSLLVQDWRNCTKEYDPVILTAKGTWKGKGVYWSKSFGNECTAHAETDGVFEF